MEQFSLEKWLQNKNRKVVTRDGRLVRIVCWDFKCYTPIIAAIQWNQEREECYCYSTNGRCANNVSDIDLFFADEEEELTDFESDLFTAFSDAWQQYLCGENVNVAEWAKEHSRDLIESARKEIEKENYEFKPKFTYNEKDYSKLANKLIEFRNNTPLCSVSYRDGEGRKVILHYEKEILDLARQELQPEIEEELDKAYRNQDEVVRREGYEKGLKDARKILLNPDYETLKNELAAYAEDVRNEVDSEESLDYWTDRLYRIAEEIALKDLPKWKRCDDNLPYSHIGGLNGKYFIKNGYCIKISDLETLPKEE